jgi:hypothetical protein
MPFFQAFTSTDMAALFAKAERTICYAGPGIQRTAANALITAAARMGPELITVCLDFDERVLRMGFGDLEAVKALKAAGINVTTTPGLRMGLAVADDVGFSFTPTALYLEAEDQSSQMMNAMRLSPDQAREALARLSPAARAAAVVLAPTAAEKQRISEIAVEVPTAPIKAEAIEQVERKIKEAPLANFDVARQVRVYNARLQYVEIELKHAAIERRRIAIPASILAIGADSEGESRFKTTFDLIEKGSKLSSKPLSEKVARLRKDFTPSLGKTLGRAIMKSAKPRFEARLEKLGAELEEFQATVEAELQTQLDNSRRAIVGHYAPLAKKDPPDAVSGIYGGDVEAWLNNQLAGVFPNACDLVMKMTLDHYYKDVTFETLQEDEFLNAVREAFPSGDWDSAHDEYCAAGEAPPSASKKGGSR